jgi:hypothetical protein
MAEGGGDSGIGFSAFSGVAVAGAGAGIGADGGGEDGAAASSGEGMLVIHAGGLGNGIDDPSGRMGGFSSGMIGVSGG